MSWRGAKLIKIKSWAVSCVKGWQHSAGAEYFTGAEICVSWPMNNRPVMLTVYFHVLTIQTPLKGHMLDCGHFCQMEKWVVEAHLATCAFISQLPPHIFALLWGFGTSLPFYLAIQHKESVTHVRAELAVHISSCELSCRYWTFSI